MRTIGCVKAVFAAVFLLAGVGLNATPFTNGSFEIFNHAAIPPNSGVALNLGDTWLTGWTVGGSGGGNLAVVTEPGDGMEAYDGQQLIEFNQGNTPPGGILSQTFDTTMGAPYCVSFAVAKAGSGNMSMTATALGSNNVLLASNYCVPTAGVWTLFSLGFIATSTSTTLVFTDTSSQTIAVDIALDDVTVTASVAPSVPAIFSFAPGLAGAGTNLTINGTNFSAVPANNIVYFGSVQASVLTASTTSLVVTVPVSATYAPITVMVNGLVAYSAQPFLPTFNGNGLGFSNSSFATRLDLPSGNSPYQVVVADLDGDGKPDLIVSCFGDHTLSIYRNISTNGPMSAASFAPRVVLVAPSGAYTPYCIAVADVDGDGKLDIITADRGNNLVSVYHNSCTPGSITSNDFATRVDFATGGGPQGIEVRDLDGDGKPDLITGNATDGTVSILRNTSAIGTLTSNSFAPKIDIATGTHCYDVVVGDLDGDGKPELVTPNWENNTVSVLRNLSTPGNIAFAPAANLAVLNGPMYVAMGDLDGDGKLDLAVSCYASKTLSVFRNISTNGSLTTNSFAPRVDYALGGAGHMSALGDLEGDGKLDVAEVTESSSLLSVFRNLSVPGSFTASSLASRVDFAAGYNPWGPAICDLDGDGRPDVVCCNTYGATISIFQNTTPFAITTGLPVIVQQPVSQTVNAGATVSFNATAAGSPSTIQWYLGTSSATNPVTGAGGTVSPLTVTASDATAGSYTAIFSNSYGTATTAVAVLTIVDPPVIATSPASIVVTADTQLTLTASATGSPSTVQWYFGTNVISGATGANLTFMAVAAASGNYSAVFSNAAGTATSAVATVTVNAGPFINGSFELVNNHAAIPSGNNAPLSPGDTWLTGWTAGGPGGDIFVWNGLMSGVVGPYDGQQWIDFNGGNTPPGGILSQTFLTTVGQAYAVSFAVEILGPGSGSMSLTATAIGSDNAVIASNYCVPATHATTTNAWSLYSLAFTANSTNTTLVFKDTSSATVAVDIALDGVTLVSAPVIVTSPVSQTNLVGTPVTFTASASGSPASVQWFQGMTPILNAANATLTFIANAGSAGDYTAVFSNAAGSATTAVAVLTVSLPAVLTQQPQSLTTNVGATVTFAGGAGGTAPMSLQWQFDGTNIPGATGANLVLTNAQPANAGSYTLVVANAYGTNTSTNAVLTFISALQVVSGTVPAVGAVSAPVTSVPVTVAVNLLATGTENGLLFNVGYNPSLLTYTGSTLGSGASGGSYSVSPGQAGQLGVFVGLDTGATFAAGTQQVVQLTFQAALVATNVTTPIGYTNQPFPAGISDVNANPLPASFLAGSLAIPATPLEGHVALSANEGYAVGITDWVQEGRFAAGLDLDYILTNAAEFQQADCAPRATLGDGSIDVADWVQVGRYALGLDPPTAAGGATAAPAQPGSVKANLSKGVKSAPQTGSRTISIVPLTQGAPTDLVAVQMAGQGNENSLQFGVTFDPAALSFISATTGTGASGARLISNTNKLAAGQLGIVVGLMPPMTFASGAQQLVKLAFKSISYSNTTSVAFADAPIGRQLVDANANTLTAAYQGASLPIAGQSWPTLAVSQNASNVILSWPYSPTILGAQWSTNSGANWTNTGGAPVTNSGTLVLTLPAPANATIYRLYGQ